MQVSTHDIQLLNKGKLFIGVGKKNQGRRTDEMLGSTHHIVIVSNLFAHTFITTLLMVVMVFPSHSNSVNRKFLVET